MLRFFLGRPNGNTITDNWAIFSRLGSKAVTWRMNEVWWRQLGSPQLNTPLADIFDIG